VNVCSRSQGVVHDTALEGSSKSTSNVYEVDLDRVRTFAVLGERNDGRPFEARRIMDAHANRRLRERHLDGRRRGSDSRKLGFDRDGSRHRRVRPKRFPGQRGARAGGLERHGSSPARGTRAQRRPPLMTRLATVK
jgi:hypothetical protein